MKLIDIDTDGGLYEDDDMPYTENELLDFKGELPYPHNEFDDDEEEELE